ncbi:MAG: ROK family protein [bacterium]
MKCTIGVDIGGTNIKAGLVCKERVIEKIMLSTKAEDGPEKCITQIKSAIQHFIDRGSAIGVGIAGIIDSVNGVVRYSPNLRGWRNIKLARILNQTFNKPVKLINDVNAILLGEWIYGAGRGYKNIFLFTLGTGIGGAAICEGKLLFGANGFAGEFGHSVINFNGPECLCGNFGCLESYAGARYIVELAQKKSRKSASNLRKYDLLTPKLIAEEARKGDRVAQEVFDEIGYYIGVGISNIINLFDPELVLVSGGIARAGKILFEPIRKTVAQKILCPEYRHTKIVPAKLYDSGGILGAAYFVRTRNLS